MHHAKACERQGAFPNGSMDVPQGVTVVIHHMAAERCNAATLAPA